MSPSERSLLGAGRRAGLLLVAAAGAAAFAAGCVLAPERAWANLLLDNSFFATLSLGAAVFLAAQSLAGAGWSVVFRRVPEAMTAYLPAGAALSALSLAGARFVYPWATAAGAAPLGAKAAYLSVPRAGLRAAVCWSVWLVLIRRLTALSRGQDRDGDPERTRRAKPLSAVLLVCFAATFSVWSVDWLMSLEPLWYSTLFPWYVFAGAFEGGLAAIAVLLAVFRERQILPQVNEHHLHDVGKYAFAFSVFWAYLWYSQYLLIWYSNIPEETAFFVRRISSAGWQALFWLDPLVNFAIPFALLLPAHRKKRGRVLAAGGALLLAGHWLDLYLLVMPPVLGARPEFGVLELAMLAGFAALYLLLFDRSFAAAPPVPARDPYIEESLHFEGV